jgi:hypothetical protein
MRRLLALVCGTFLAGPQLPLLAQPAATLGAPRPVSTATDQATSTLRSSAGLGTPQPVIRAASPDGDPLLGDFRPMGDRRLTSSSGPAARLGPLQTTGISLTPMEEPTSPEERYNWGFPDSPFPKRRPTDTNHESHWGIFHHNGDSGEPILGNGHGGGAAFESDHDFDNFISPLTNPFLAEDPRKLTELRPIFMFQTIPNSNVFFNGGNIENFALQGRLGLTENWSVVMHKLGFIVINPGSFSLLDGTTALTEIWLGPKWTFWKDCECGTVAATGIIFQIPVGGHNAFQDTGDFGMVPYVTAAQKFWRTSVGQFTAMDTLGYSFGFNSGRSDFVYNSLHFDYDVANWGRIFPLVELNWFHYTSNGTERPWANFEMEDLGNVGAPVKGRDFLSLAIGARYKATEAITLGLATEFPLVGTRDLDSFRLTMDLIWRY